MFRYKQIDKKFSPSAKLLKVHERSSRNEKEAAFPSRFPIKSQLFEIPTLEEVIILVKGLSKSFGRNIGLYIELKAPEFHRKHKLDPAKELLSLQKSEPEMLKTKNFGRKSLNEIKVILTDMGSLTV